MVAAPTKWSSSRWDLAVSRWHAAIFVNFGPGSGRTLTNGMSKHLPRTSVCLLGTSSTRRGRPTSRDGTVHGRGPLEPSTRSSLSWTACPSRCTTPFCSCSGRCVRRSGEQRDRATGPSSLRWSCGESAGEEPLREVTPDTQALRHSAIGLAELDRRARFRDLSCQAAVATDRRSSHHGPTSSHGGGVALHSTPASDEFERHRWSRPGAPGRDHRRRWHPFPVQCRTLPHSVTPRVQWRLGTDASRVVGAWL